MKGASQEEVSGYGLQDRWKRWELGGQGTSWEVVEGTEVIKQQGDEGPPKSSVFQHRQALAHHP